MITKRPFASTDDVIDAVEILLRETLMQPGALMLSGGSTPYAAYNRLSASPCFVHPARRLFLSDERMQPLDSDQNNAHNLSPMLQALNCTDRFIRVDTTRPIEEAAAGFEKMLAEIDSVDIGLLGMGADGHTAGFFTPEQARLKSGPLVLHTDRPDDMQGISVTAAFLQSVERIILVVTGESKKTVVNTLMSDPQQLAAGIALSDHPNVELWTDC